MKKLVTKNLTYSLKNAVIGDRKRTVLVIDATDKSKIIKKSASRATSISSRGNFVKKCGGCSRKRRKNWG